MKKSGASLDEKEIHELWCPLNTIHAITACKVEIHRKENLLLTSAERKKKKKSGKRVLIGSYISFTPT